MSAQWVINVILMLILFTSSKCQNYFFLVKKDESTLSYCVTNSSFALSWIDEDIKQPLDTVSVFKRSVEQRDFEEDMKSQIYLPDAWSLQNSLNGTINEVIFDRRWEKMKVHMTVHEEHKEPLKFITVISTLRRNFVIPMSIRIEKAAHIFLCDGNDVSKSNCYWFLLQSFTGQKSVFRKCNIGQIPLYNNKLLTDSCKTILIENVHPSDNKTYLTSRKWSHFKLMKKENRLSFIQADGTRNNEIMEYIDSGDVINVSHMIVHSKLVNGLWKIHELQYIYTNKVENNVKLWPPINLVDGSVCISMFISMCQFCKLTLALISAKNSSQIIQEQTYLFSDQKGWREIRFVVDNIQSNVVDLFYSTIAEPQHEEIYWALDNLRQCQKGEFRIMGLNEQATCQLLSNVNEANIISIQNSVTNIDNSCPENTIGKFCVPCRWIYENCDNVKICENYEKIEIKCACSAGFRNYDNDNCQHKCSGRTHGHNCGKKCGKCDGDCNSVDGKCSKCIENYSGSKCTIPPPPIMFKYPPEVVIVKNTRAMIHVNNFELLYTENNEQPQDYTIQYKKAKDGNDNWTNHKLKYKFKNEMPFEISDLDINTEYVVRGKVITFQASENSDSALIPSASFKTTCDVISENNIDLQPSNTSVIINLIKTTKETCKINESQINIVDIAETPRFLTDDTILINKLTPYTFYTISFKNDANKVMFEKKIKTTEGVPEKVGDFNLKNQSPSSVRLEWEKPASIHGKLKHYTVEYKHISYMGCGQNLSDLNRLNTHILYETSLPVNNLIPFSYYSFSVFATNEKFDGQRSTKWQTTDFLDKIQEQEIPNIVQITPNTCNAQIEFSSIHCSKLRGPLLIKLNARCGNEWCKTNITENFYYRSEPTPVVHLLSNLDSFSNYNLEVQFCRNDTFCGNISKSKAFSTKPSAPFYVVDLLVYSKDENSISLRWMPPYAPTGVLKDYVISYFDSNSKQSVQSVNSSCKLWPTFLCAKLTDLSANCTYKITVSARNEDPEDLGMAQIIEATTSRERSQAPYDLVITWTLKNDLELEWKHPNVTNGDIQSFDISLDSSGFTLHSSFINGPNIILKQLSVAEDQYTYRYKIEASDLLPSTFYKIKVRAYNGYTGVIASDNDTSPPAIPSLDIDPIFSTSNKAITVKISLQKLKISDDYNLFLLVSDKTVNIQTHPEFKRFEGEFRLSFPKFKILYECSLRDSEKLFTIGDEDGEVNNCNKKKNPSLNPGTSYNVTLILTNTFMNKTRYKIYSFNASTMPPESKNSHQLGLLSLLILIPITLFIFLKRRWWLSKCYNNLPESEEYEIPLNPTEVQQYEDNLQTVRYHEDNLQTVRFHEDNLQTEANVNTDGPSVYSKLIKTAQLKEYVKTSMKNGELEQQHVIVLRSRNNAIYAKIKEERYFDYIDMDYNDGHKIPKAYVTTEPPKGGMIGDFWKTIWEDHIEHIILVNDEKEATNKYWPEENQKFVSGNICVQHAFTKKFANYEHRMFTLISNEVVRNVDQICFSSWSSHGSDVHSLVPFFKRISIIPLNSQSPILIHSSVGIKDTGFVLLCDMCLRMAKKDGSIDVLRNLYRLGDHEKQLIGNLKQYKLAHLVILEFLLGTDIKTKILCNNFNKFIKEGVRSQIRYLQQRLSLDQVMKIMDEEISIMVHSKNRCQNIVPGVQGCVLLSRYPPDDEASAYINAVKLDGFKSPGRFIVTQQPMPSTLGDFWKLVHENDVSVIVSLNEIYEADKSCCDFWPNPEHPQISPLEFICLRHNNTTTCGCYDIITVQLHLNGEKEYKTVNIISLKNWPAKTSCPKNLGDFVKFCAESNELLKKSNVTIITCYDGARASGLYATMLYNIEYMKQEDCSDICSSVRSVRRNRQEFVDNEEQLIFLYMATADYINNYYLYANFQ